MTLNRISFSPWTVPLALLGLALLAYGPLIPLLGFYWDDLPYLWLYHVQGPPGFVDFVASDRPFSAWIFMLTTTLFGETAWPYHLFALLLRWLTAWVFWWVLKYVWPGEIRAATWAAFLFLVYPGFKQQPIALIYNHHFSVLFLFLLSLVCMLLAVRKPRWFLPLTGLGLVFSAGMFSIEYFAGLELLRPVLLWLVMDEAGGSWKRKAGRVMRHWLPYLAMLGLFLYWRVFVFRFPSYQPQVVDRFLQAPLPALSELVRVVVTDFYTVVFIAWTEILQLPSGPLSWLAYLAIVAIGIAAVWFFLDRLKSPEPTGGGVSGDRWARQALAVGSFAFLLGGLPVWITGLPVRLTYPFDRLTLGFLVGVGLVLVGHLELLFRSLVLRKVILVGLVGLSLGLHLQNANAYRRNSQILKDFLWQLTWRAPGLEPGTILLNENPPWTYYSDNSLTAPLNWTYAPGSSSLDLSYMFYDLDVRLGEGLPDLKKGLPVNQEYRSMRFSGSTADILAVYYRPPGCVQVLDPLYTVSYPDLPHTLQKAVSLSDLSQISLLASSPASPPPNLFGSEPERSWCYYFEKAELARQAGAWPEVVTLWENAARDSRSPAEASEWLPFMEAFARVRDWEKAEQLAEQMMKNRDLRPMVCTAWERIAESMELEAPEKDIIGRIRSQADCNG